MDSTDIAQWVVICCTAFVIEADKKNNGWAGFWGLLAVVWLGAYIYEWFK